MTIVLLVGVIGAVMLAYGLGLLIAAMPFPPSWDAPLEDLSTWIHDPKFLRGIIIFLSSFLVFGLTFLLAVTLLA